MVARESAETLNGMGSIAFIFPGQGSQYVGMAKDIAEHSSEAREIVAEADEILGFSLSKVCFEGPEDELRQTKNTQPAIFLHAIVLSKLYRGTALRVRAIPCQNPAS